MGLFNFLSNKNVDYLKDDELEAAKLLQGICSGYASGNPNSIPNGVVKLSFGIYMMAFNRTDFNMIPLAVLNDAKSISKQTKLKYYVAFLEKIKQNVSRIVNDSKVQANCKNNKLFETLLLKVLKTCVQDLEKLNAQ